MEASVRYFVSSTQSGLTVSRPTLPFDAESTPLRLNGS